MYPLKTKQTQRIVQKLFRLPGVTLFFLNLALWAGHSNLASAADPADLGGGIFLSSVKPAQNLSLLQQLGITHILNLTGTHRGSDKERFPNAFPDQFSYLHLSLSDEMDTDILAYLAETHAFLENAVASGGKILIHCEAGISRSSTIAISFLMKNRKMTLKSAYEFVKQRKPNIGPNAAFFSQLISYESQLAFEGNLSTETTSSSREIALPTLSLKMYLAEQLLEGPAAGFSQDQVIRALERAQLDPNQTLAILFSM